MFTRLTSLCVDGKGVVLCLAALSLASGLGSSPASGQPVPDRPVILFPAGEIRVYVPSQYTIEYGDGTIILRWKLAPGPGPGPGPGPPTPTPTPPPKRPDWLPPDPPPAPVPTPISWRIDQWPLPQIVERRR